MRARLKVIFDHPGIHTHTSQHASLETNSKSIPFLTSTPLSAASPFLIHQVRLFTGVYGLKKVLFGDTSYLKAHQLGNRYPEKESPTYIPTMSRIRTRALGDPSDHKARVGPLYHGDFPFHTSAFPSL
ncbi:hypothetical protein E2C01_086746 [Portunus trituberculatus]|uniref:Uncharacterized protein n=1 Tax=Portunus trituberculatus TaxID=210409 RepID=A0A5B7J1N8_PORTR|nr:hypothetical protein [Portunus trituberculatus]